MSVLVSMPPQSSVWKMIQHVVMVLQVVAIGVPLLILRYYGYRLGKTSMPSQI